MGLAKRKLRMGIYAHEFLINIGANDFLKNIIRGLALEPQNELIFLCPLTLRSIGVLRGCHKTMIIRALELDSLIRLGYLIAVRCRGYVTQSRHQV